MRKLFLSLLGLATATLLQPANLAAHEWAPIAALPIANSGFACGVIAGEIVIAGGTNWTGETKHWLNQIYAYSPETNRWRGVGRLPQSRSYAATGTTERGLFMAGGSTGEETVAVLSLLDASFQSREIAPLAPRFVYAASTVQAGELYVLGGAPTQAALAQMSPACRAIDLASGRIRHLPSLPIPGMTTATAASCAGRIHVFGGARWDNALGDVRNADEAFVFDPKTERWSALPKLPTPNRGLTAIALDAGHLLLAGGYKGDTEGFTTDAFIFDAATATYTPAKPLPYPAMVSLIVCGEYLYCLGGEDLKKHRTAAAFRIPLSQYARPR